MATAAILSRYRLVLAGPRFPGNVGASARVAANFGVRDFRVSAPLCDPRGGEAPRYAVGPARDTLEKMRVTSTLAEALEDCEAAVGFTRREGRHRIATLELKDVPSLPARRIALVFGNEETGLTSDELKLCTHVCAFDTAPELPSLNLSHAVAVALSRCFEIEQSSYKDGRPKKGSAPLQEQEALFAHWRELLIDAGMTQGGNPDRILERIRRILQRASISSLDVRLLRGFLSRTQVSLGTRKRGKRLI